MCIEQNPLRVINTNNKLKGIEGLEKWGTRDTSLICCILSKDLFTYGCFLYNVSSSFLNMIVLVDGLIC